MTELCPKCKRQSPYCANPYYVHQCDHCGHWCSQSDLIVVKEINMEQTEITKLKAELAAAEKEIKMLRDPIEAVFLKRMEIGDNEFMAEIEGGMISIIMANFVEMFRLQKATNYIGWEAEQQGEKYTLTFQKLLGENPANKAARLESELTTERAAREQAEKERDHWKANHDDMVVRNAALRSRLDMPADRVLAVQRLAERAERAEKERDEALEKLKELQHPSSGFHPSNPIPAAQ